MFAILVMILPALFVLFGMLALTLFVALQTIAIPSQEAQATTAPSVIVATVAPLTAIVSTVSVSRFSRIPSRAISRLQATIRNDSTVVVMSSLIPLHIDVIEDTIEEDDFASYAAREVVTFLPVPIIAYFAIFQWII